MPKANCLILGILLISLCSCAAEKKVVRTDESLFLSPPKKEAIDVVAAQRLQDAVRLLRASDPASALLILRQIMEQYPETPWFKRALFLSEQAFIRLGNISNAESLMLRIRGEYPELADYAVFALAECHYNEGRYTEAAALFHVVERDYAKSSLVARAGYKRAAALLEAKAAAQAAEVFQKLLDDADSDVAAGSALGLAQALAAAGRADDAARAYQNVWINYPGNSFDDEVAQKLESLKKDGTSIPKLSAQELYQRGFNLFASKQYDKALESFKLFLGKGKGSSEIPEALFKSAVSAYMLGKRAEAATTLETLVKRYPTHARVPEALLWTGRSYSKLGDWDRARKAFGKVLGRFPKSESADDALFYMGNIYRELNDTDKALDFYGRLAREYPTSKYADSAIWWQAWTRYTSDDYEEAIELLQQLISRYPRSFLVPQALYWQGRAAEKMSNLPGAKSYYQKLLRRGSYTFYGYRAAERLAALGVSEAASKPDAIRGTDAAAPSCSADVCLEDISAALDDEAGPPVWTEETRQLLAADPLFKKTYELMLVDMKKEAAAELWSVQVKKTRKRGMRLGLSKALFELGDYYHSYMLIATAYERFLDSSALETPEDLWRLAYPRAYWDSIVAYARKYKQDPYFIAAIMREESQFKFDALSSAGARGLLQVMPSTGSRVARRINMRGFNSEKLYEPDTVINIGTWYVSQLMKQFKNNPLLVAAAYNAGPAAVSSWLSRVKNIPDHDEFVEAIPYKETRGYVKKVIRNYEEYRRIYGKRPGTSHPALLITTVGGEVPEDATEE